MATDVSVVIATRNRHERLGELLAALEAQTYPLDRFEVVIVDDASGPQTAAVLERAGSSGRLRLRSIRRETRGGPAIARDQGWRTSSAELIAFTDDDCAPQPGWLTAGLAAASSHPGAIVQGRTDPNPAELDSAGPFSRTISVPGPDPGFQCCNVFYPRALLEQIDGFDTETFVRWGGEDADLGWRALKAGGTPVFAPQALVHHAINELGPLRKLHQSSRWSIAMAAYARHDGLRRAHFSHWLFWKPTHYWLLRALVALVLPARWSPLRNWLLYPYARSLYARGKLGGNVLLAPYFVLDDLVEVYAVARGGARFRKLML